jgi:polar amino acid transport system ATP-binding protein
MTDHALTPTAAVAPMIAMEGAEKWYGNFKALTDINLTVRTGEKIVLREPVGIA